MIRRNSVVFDEISKKFRIDWKESNSYLMATLQLEAVLSARKYAKGKLLDVGCGNKPFLHVFKDRVEDYIGIDMPSTRHLNKEIDAFSSGMNLPFKAGSFDTILTSSVLEHVKEPQKMFEEMYRVSRKNSYLILTTPCMYGLHEQPHDYFRYTKHSLRMLAEKCGFRVVQIKPIGGMFTIIAHLTAKYLSISLYVLLEKIRGNKINKEKGFKGIKKNIVAQFISFIPQKLILILYKFGLKKLDDLSAEIDPCLYLMVAKK